MLKVLIVEDEPLVQIGIRSMINWTNHAFELCPTAKDGIQGLEYIHLYQPDIVITDIKMPRMDGLALIKTAKETFGALPLFIVLTSYEEFKYIKEAMKYDVIDYLLKLELNAEDLILALDKAKNKFETVRNVTRESSLSISNNDTSHLFQQSFYDKYFIKLLYNLFDSNSQGEFLANELNLNLDYKHLALSYHELIEPTYDKENYDKSKLLNLYSSTLQMVKELTKKYNTVHVVTLDTKHFAILYCLREDEVASYRVNITKLLQTIFTMIHNYFNVHILSSVSKPYASLYHTFEAFQDVRELSPLITMESPIVFFDDITTITNSRHLFNLSLFRDSIKRAFEEYNTSDLYQTFTEISTICKSNPARYLQSIDAASNILYLAISLLPNGEETVQAIFMDDVDNYRSLYKTSNVEQVSNWLLLFRDGLCRILEEEKKNYRNHTVYNVKKYIDTHVHEKITLPNVANIFGLSPNYLSQLFKKYSDDGFTDYVTKSKIRRAKELMTNSNLKLYEISDQLGFESSFYFSKVFKKVEGVSPREFSQEKLLTVQHIIR